MTFRSNNPGVIGDKSYLHPTQTAEGAMWNSRSPSPSDSDTSGFGSECSSEAALVDLMVRTDVRWVGGGGYFLIMLHSGLVSSYILHVHDFHAC